MSITYSILMEYYYYYYYQSRIPLLLDGPNEYTFCFLSNDWLYGLRPESVIGILRITSANNDKEEQDHVDAMHCDNELVGCSQKFVGGQYCNKNSGCSSIYGIPSLLRSGVTKIMTTVPNDI